MEYFQMPELLKALREQTEAINRLANSNEMLVQAMANMDEDIAERTQYLDGTPTDAD